MPRRLDSSTSSIRLLGTPQRASASFGPFFTERSLTTGAGRLTLGASFTSRRYTTLDGRDLDDGTFVTSGNQFRDEAAPFDVETLSMSLESQAPSRQAPRTGCYDRVDVGVVVPFVTIDLRGQRTNTYRGTAVVQATADATASGIGDVAVRGKVRLLGDRGSGLASIAEVQLPTGREEDLLGAGTASTFVAMVVSGEAGAFAGHGTVGATLGGLSPGFQYRGAFTANVSRQVTLVGELIGRTVDEAGRVVLTRVPHPTIIGVDTLRLLPEGDSTHHRPGRARREMEHRATWLIGAHVILPVTDEGLKASRAFVIGLEYSWPGADLRRGDLPVVVAALLQRKRHVPRLGARTLIRRAARRSWHRDTRRCPADHRSRCRNRRR